MKFDDKQNQVNKHDEFIKHSEEALNKMINNS